MAVAILLLVKVGSLSQMGSEWQPFAVLMMPILARGAQTLGIIFTQVCSDINLFDEIGKGEE